MQQFKPEASQVVTELPKNKGMKNVSMRNQMYNATKMSSNRADNSGHKFNMNK